MLITRKRSNDVINIYLNNRRLEQVTEMKYLGIYFDSRLTFHKHTEHIAEKSNSLIYMLSKSAKLQWGLGNKSLKMVYEGALVPIMTYEAPVWEDTVTKLKIPQKDAKCTEADKHQNREDVQNHLLRSILSDGRSPTLWNCDLQLYKRKHGTE
jgi:hypothetical protein